MSTAKLRDEFNAVATIGGITAQKAFLSYERAEGREWQKLAFQGINADGTAFSLESGRLPRKTDLMAQARTMAHELIENSQ